LYTARLLSVALALRLHEHALRLAGEPAMKLNGEYTWDLSQPATLVDLDLTIESGAFVAVVGPTGL